MLILNSQTTVESMTIRQMKERESKQLNKAYACWDIRHVLGARSLSCMLNTKVDPRGIVGKNGIGSGEIWIRRVIYGGWRTDERRGRTSWGRMYGVGFVSVSATRVLILMLTFDF